MTTTDRPTTVDLAEAATTVDRAAAATTVDFAEPPGARDDLTAALAFVCPRCGADVRAAFYGPCASCRSDLRAAVHAEARAVEAAAYEPKMNVVPNQIATKD